jgi:hypothetical protein
MTARLANGPVRLRAWARRGLMLALPLPLLALAAAAFAIAANSMTSRASARPDQRLVPPAPLASLPAPADHSRFAVARARSSGGGVHCCDRGARSTGGAWSRESCGDCS